ncbi:MAG TPA: hydrogenase maturation nickel metallochaperone HypA [Treponemataceae bacterium]|nr:hydrogenase maturation nickel metallochaperone HypA [Treponemataceae bacterium]
MHELGIVMNIAETVEKFAAENEVTQVASITLQVGELSSIVPHYLLECFPAAVDRSDLLRDTELKIEILTANCMCHICNKVYSFMENRKTCPLCGKEDTEIISGREFFIKEIEAC